MSRHHAYTAMTLATLSAMAALTLIAPARAGTLTGATFVNDLALSGSATDLSSGSAAERRLGYFSDIAYDPVRREWWGLSDRGPGGGLLDYATRVQRFTVDVAPDGRISNFQVAATVKFTDGGSSLNGLAPDPSSTLGRAFDPEGIAVIARTGHLLVSDEYGPTLAEFDRNGNLVRRFEVPANLVPRNGATGVPNHAGDAGNTAGKRTNRGFEGLTLSPDGRYAYAMLQSAMLDEGGGDGRIARIVKFDVETGQAVAQYAYQMERSGQGQGVSSLLALGGDRFLVLERNNRGVGVGATLATADKRVFEIDLSGATDVSALTLGPTSPLAVTKTERIDVDAVGVAALSGRTAEKWEGMAIGPQLGPDLFLMLMGTDNDYSVTQSGAGQQFDVWFRFGDADPYAGSIQCPIGEVSGCFFTTGGAPAMLSDDFELLPGLLRAYAVSLSGFEAQTVPAPASLVLALAGLALLAAGRRRAA